MFTASSTLLDGTEWTVGLSTKGMFTYIYGPMWLDINNKSQSLSCTSSPIEEGTTYVLTQGQTQYLFSGEPGVSGKDGSIAIINAAKGTGADKTLSSLADIAKWLKDYGVPVQ